MPGTNQAENPMHVSSQIEGFVLVGGASSRMGRDKAMLEWEGEPLALKTARRVARVATRVTLVGDPQRYATFGLAVIADRWPSEGPLGGMITALEASRAPASLIVACDMPFLTVDWLAFLCGCGERMLQNSAAEAIVPQSERGSLEPLSAIYRKNCAAQLRDAFERGARKVTEALAELKLEVIAPAEWRRFSPDGSLFRNVNTPEDYNSIRKRSSPE